MKKFYLKSGNEIINQSLANSFEEALVYFSSIKKLSKNKILNLFKIETE
jgi:hypothetical protein